MMRTVNTDWGRGTSLHFTLDQDRLQATGLTSNAVAQQLQFLLSGIPITSVREDIRSVQVTGRAAGDIRLDPAKIEGFTLVGNAGQRIPLAQIGRWRSEWKTRYCVVAIERPPLPCGGHCR
jgi:multidrug efflux pump subunit AcrB